MTLDLAKLKEAAEKATEGCRQCGSEATTVAHFQSGGIDIFCDACIQNNEAIADEIDAHEMREFGGQYGLCPRPSYTPIERASHATILALIERLESAEEIVRAFTGDPHIGHIAAARAHMGKYK